MHNNRFPTPLKMAPKQKINFITIAVADLIRATNFYNYVFGFETNDIITPEAEHCIIELEDNFMLALSRRDHFNIITQQDTIRTQSSGFVLSHNADSREEVEAIWHRAQELGAFAIGSPIDESWGYSVTFTDLDGHYWEVAYMKPIDVPSSSQSDLYSNMESEWFV